MISTGNGAERSATTSNVVAVLERCQEAADDLADHRLERGDRPGREHPADEGPEPVVLGRVHHDDHPEAADEVGVLGQRRQVDAVRARQALPVAVGRDDVGEARQGVEAVALAEVHGGLVAQAAVDLGRVVEVLGRERVELDGGRGHGASWKATHASGESIAFRRTIVSAPAQRVADEGRCRASSDPVGHGQRGPTRRRRGPPARRPRPGRRARLQRRQGRARRRRAVRRRTDRGHRHHRPRRRSSPSTPTACSTCRRARSTRWVRSTTSAGSSPAARTSCRRRSPRSSTRRASATRSSTGSRRRAPRAARRSTAPASSPAGPARCCR